jgi:TM2 domain-containing membrane protein YozV
MSVHHGVFIFGSAYRPPLDAEPHMTDPHVPEGQQPRNPPASEPSFSEQPTAEHAASSAIPPPNPVAGVSAGQAMPDVNSKKVLVGVLALILGSLGVHKFILGYTSAGVIMLAVTVVGSSLSIFCFPIIAPLAMWGIGIAEGIIYLTKSDAEFKAIYLEGKREWL